MKDDNSDPLTALRQKEEEERQVEDEFFDVSFGNILTSVCCRKFIELSVVPTCELSVEDNVPGRLILNLKS